MNFALENLGGKIKYPWKYHEFGCEEGFTPEQTSHQAECPHKPFKCPLSIHEVQRVHMGSPVATIRNHIKSKHTELGNQATITGTHTERLSGIGTNRNHILAG